MRIEHLTVTTRSGKRLISDFSLEAPSGRSVLLVGPSGSGKSTLLEVLAGVSPHRVEGVVTWDDDHKPVMAVQESREAFSPYRRLGVQLLDAVPGASESYRTGFLRMCSELGLQEGEALWRMYPHELSQGMLKRVLLAGLLAMEGPRLVLDEPTAGVDPSLRWAVWKAIVAHAPDTILSSHDLQVKEVFPEALVVDLSLEGRG